MVRVVVAALIGATVLATVYAAAAGFNLTSSTVGSGNAVIAECDTSEPPFPALVQADFDFEMPDMNLIAVTVNDVAPECATGELQIVLTSDGTEVTRGSAIVPGGGGSVSVSVTPVPFSKEFVNGASIIIVGP